MTALMAPDEMLASQKEQFLGKVQKGIPRLHAALDVGWTIRKMHLLLANADFMELVQTAEAYVSDDVEMVLLQKAKDGNMEAIKMWLQNRSRDRWADRREIAVTGTVEVAQVIIDGTRDGLRAMLEEHTGVIEAVMPGGFLDEDIVDAELVE